MEVSLVKNRVLVLILRVRVDESLKNTTYACQHPFLRYIGLSAYKSFLKKRYTRFFLLLLTIVH